MPQGNVAGSTQQATHLTSDMIVVYFKPTQCSIMLANCTDRVLGFELRICTWGQAVNARTSPISVTLNTVSSQGSISSPIAVEPLTSMSIITDQPSVISLLSR